MNSAQTWLRILSKTIWINYNILINLCFGFRDWKLNLFVFSMWIMCVWICGCELYVLWVWKCVYILGLLCIFHRNWVLVNGIILRNQQYEQIEKKKCFSYKLTIIMKHNKDVYTYTRQINTNTHTSNVISLKAAFWEPKWR